ncbi:MULTISPECIES: hypothetical protein [Bacteroides]|uniref:hypothetical protein n=1 Tax=Bacteroides TaxID=816 RepID=UPI00242FBDDB|nr:hypothetical protein [Bacteroides caecimuris]
MSPNKVSWLFMQGLHSKYDLCLQRWRFGREPSGYDLAYKNDMTYTFATQFSSGSQKVNEE